MEIPISRLFINNPVRIHQIYFFLRLFHRNHLQFLYCAAVPERAVRVSSHPVRNVPEIIGKEKGGDRTQQNRQGGGELVARAGLTSCARYNGSSS